MNDITKMSSNDDSDRFYDIELAEGDAAGGGDDDSNSEGSPWYDGHGFKKTTQLIAENDPLTTSLEEDGSEYWIQNMSLDKWEELGRNISNNTHLTELLLYGGTLNDHNIPSLFRGLTRSSSIKFVTFGGFSAEGIRSMVPFLHHTDNLRMMNLSGNNIQSAGFNLLIASLRDSPIKTLCCNNCGIESIEINSEHIPRKLNSLSICDNNINADGCRGLAELLTGRDVELENLDLRRNRIDDEGVDVLVDALQNNTSLESLDLRENDGISTQGYLMLLKLVNDISSIEATLQSNHTLTYLRLDYTSVVDAPIRMATNVNRNNKDNPEAAGREKVIKTQLHSRARAVMADLQGVNRSLYSEINPLHLPEVLSLVCRRHGPGELYVALKSSIAGVISTVNRKQCVEAKIAYHAAKLEELVAELAEINKAAGFDVSEAGESRSSKRRRE